MLIFNNENFRTFKLAFAGALFAYTIVESLSEPTRLTGFGGYVFFVIFMVVFSNRPRKVSFPEIGAKKPTCF